MEARGIKGARVGTVDKFQGAAGASRHLFVGVGYGRGRTEGHGVSLRSAAAQRGNIARTLLANALCRFREVAQGIHSR